ncbi:aldolase [Virgibacillus necropolis]|uniref:HPr kinase/phosphorylase n=1 Tax=Virgibacillus necropolis TaxID=163877 RepID=UPI003850DBA3
MMDIVRKVAYRAFGLNIFSDIPLPELPQVNLAEIQMNIEIRKTDLKSLWSELSIPNRHFVVKEDLIMFQVPETAIFLIQNGREIFVSPFEGSKDDQIRLYILGTCMGALLMQRKSLPLHGSAIVIDGKAYAIVGDSGAGKSTLASAFLKKGYQLLSDDVIPVTLSENNIPIVTPAYPQQKLWIESLDQFGIDSNSLRPIIDRETKFAVPVSTQFSDELMPLAGVFELVKTDRDEIDILPIQKLQRLHTLFNHTYRNFIIARSGLMEWHFNTSTKIISNIELYKVRRPTSRFTAHELVDLILAKIHKGEKIT